MPAVSGRWVRRGLPVVAAAVLLGAFSAARAVRAEDEAPRAEAKWRSSTQGLQVTGVAALAVHPKAPEDLYAFVLGLGIAHSTDGGVTWKPVMEGIPDEDRPGPRDTCTIAFDPEKPKVLYAVPKGKVYRSENGGERWTYAGSQELASYSADNRTTKLRVLGVRIDPGKSNHLLAGSVADDGFHGGLYESRDGTKRWTLKSGSNKPVLNPALPYGAWPICIDGKTDKNIVVGSPGGLFRSEDLGVEFVPVAVGGVESFPVQDLTDVLPGKEVYLCDERGVWWSRDGGKRFEKEPLLQGDAVAIAVDHAGKRLLVALRDRGVTIRDSKKKWSEPVLADAEITQTLLHPTKKEIVYAASPVTGLHVSKDRGATFQPVASTPAPSYVTGIVAAAAHVETGWTLAVGDSGVVYASKDHAATWERTGRLGMRPLCLAAGAEPGVWYAGGTDLMKTSDHGKTWETVFRGDVGDRVVALRVTPDGMIRGLLERGLSVIASADGGKQWAESASAARAGPGLWATSFAVDPTNAEHLLLATRTDLLRWTPKEEDGGAYESWDGGKTWAQLAEGIGAKSEKPLKHWNVGSAVWIDPQNNLLLYAAHGLGVLARSIVAPAPSKAGEKAPPPPPWVVVPGQSITNAVVEAFLAVPRADGSDVDYFAQSEGDNGTRVLLGTSGSRLRAALDAMAAGKEAGPTWDTLPDPQTVLTCLSADPVVAGRLLGCDSQGDKGVLVLELAGPPPPPAPEKPAEEAPPPPQKGPPPAPDLAVYAVGKDRRLRRWTPAEDKAAVEKPDAATPIDALVRSPDGTVLAWGGGDRAIHLGKPDDLSETATLGPAENGAAIASLAWHPKGTHLVAGLRENWYLVVWDVAAKTAKRLEGHAGEILAVAVSPDGSRAYSGGQDLQVLSWDLTACTQAGKLADFPGEVLALAVSTDGNTVFVGGRGSPVRAYSAVNGVELATADVGGTCFALALSPDGTKLYAATTGGVRALNAADLAPLITHAGPARDATSVGLSRDGKWIAAGDSEGGLWLWGEGVAEASWSAPVSTHGTETRAVAVLDAAPALPAAPPPGDKPPEAPSDPNAPSPPSAPDGGAPNGGADGAEGGGTVPPTEPPEEPGR